jgi:hypothetical protein
MTIPIVSRKMRPQRLTDGHRDRRNPRCGFELINAAVVAGLLTVTRHPVTASWPGKSAKRVFALDVPAIHV